MYSKFDSRCTCISLFNCIMRHKKAVEMQIITSVGSKTGTCAYVHLLCIHVYTCIQMCVCKRVQSIIIYMLD